MTVVKRFDSGLNLKHRDVVKKLWRNTAEIPGIGVDDDFNGFVDDVHGFDALTSAGSRRRQSFPLIGTIREVMVGSFQWVAGSVMPSGWRTSRRRFRWRVITTP